MSARGGINEDEETEIILSQAIEYVGSYSAGDYLVAEAIQLSDRSKFGQSIKLMKAACKYFGQNKNRIKESMCYGEIGRNYLELDNYPKALEFHEKALDIALEIGDKNVQTKSLANIGKAHLMLGNYLQAAKTLKRALRHGRMLNDKIIQLSSYLDLGTVYGNVGNYPKALEYCYEALNIAEDIEDKDLETDIGSNIGVIFSNMGDYMRAIEFHEKALNIALEIGDNVRIARSYKSLGRCFQNQSNYPKAIEYQEKALSLIAEYNGLPVKENRLIEEECCSNLGNIYNDLGDYMRAIEFHEKALNIALGTGDRIMLGSSYTEIGNDYKDLGDYPKALEFHENALDIALEIGNRDAEARAYGNVANVHSRLKNYTKAIEFYMKDLEIAKQIRNRFGEAACYVGIGICYSRMNQFKESSIFYKKASRLSNLIGNLKMSSIVKLYLGELFVQHGKLKLGYNHLKQSIHLSESVGGMLVEQEQKIGFYGLSSDAYSITMRVCLRMNKKEEAFDYVERSKSKAFIDLLATSTIEPTYALTDQKRKALKPLLKQEHSIIQKIRQNQNIQLNSNFDKMSANSSSLNKDTLENLMVQREKLYENMLRIDPQYVSLRMAKPLSLNKLQKLLATNTILIEYFFSDDKLFIFTVESNDFNVKTVELTWNKLSEYINNFSDEVVKYPEYKRSGKAVTNRWLQLSKYLMDSIADRLKENKLIYFVPHGPIHYLPLHALLIGRIPLIKNHPVAYLPSSSLLQFYMNSESKPLRSCTVFGVDFRDEAKDVAAIFETKPLLDATKNQVLENLNSDILHFSCHGSFNYKDSISSGIELKDDILHASEIFNLNLKSKLVTLSACETGVNENKSGDELIGISRALIYAGASSLVVSLWSVSGYTTKDLMRLFYSNIKHGYGIAVALQKAQVKLREELIERYGTDGSNPFFWAAFVLIGGKFGH